MANQIAAAILTRPGDELVVEETAHIVLYELGGAARHSGLQIRALRGDRGTFEPDQLRSVFARGDFWTPATGLVAVENTHNSSGGSVWPLDRLDAVVGTARELGVPVHLDGARLLNAAVALGVPAARIAGQFDTVTLCLSKGLGCPIGALVAGSRELTVRARREKHALGGAMRQTGIVAAAGLYALDNNVERLADDHARAARLAEAWAAAGLAAAAATNFVRLDVRPLGLAGDEAIELLAQAGVGLSDTTHPGVLRAVLHLDVDDDDVDRALELVPQVLRRRRLDGAAGSAGAGSAGAGTRP
jgi:threonine aldolase